MQATTKEIKKGNISGCYPLLLVNPEQDLFASAAKQPSKNRVIDLTR
jgi:hypothetical protein